jgi:CRP-like cAMP-binding protein
METELNKMRESLQKLSEINDKDWKAIKEKLQAKTFKKGDVFINEGQVCKQLGFLVSGIARVYYLANGKEVTSYFNIENRNPLVCAFTSFLSQKPSFEVVHFIEDTQLLLLTYKQLQELYTQNPNIQKLGRIMAEHNYVLSMERIYSLQHAPAIDRYKHLLTIYPGLTNLVPHHYIASYLGITPESFSRIRKELVKSIS